VTATTFWLILIAILAIVDLAAYLLPGDLSFSATVRRWGAVYPWLRLVYVVGVVLLYWHFWGS
jgi:hypothetical protein